MKILTVLFFPIILFLIGVNCRSSVISKPDSWKEKYDIKSGTGVLFGEFIMNERWKNQSFNYYLIKTEGFFEKTYLFDQRINKQKMEEELRNSPQDSISVLDSVLLIKNITPGEYMFFCHSIWGMYGIFEGRYCSILKISIKKDSISMFPKKEIVPGVGHIAEVDIHTGTETQPPSNCSFELNFQKLNEKNYWKLIKKNQ